ncbi:MAG: ABC transporter ATP-binding protein [Halanaerobiales bacterium]
MTAAIEINNLRKKFNKVEAVKGISFTVHRGEIFGFLGPNGAGKTSTIRMICGLSKPTSGTCKITGKKDAKTVQPGVVFEESNLYSRLSGEANLKFFAGLYGVGGDKIEQLLKDFELYGDRKRPVKNYSRGMKQRLLICRALLNNPRLLILDEPTGGLDPSSAHYIREAILDLKGEGKTVFLTTHYMEEADQLCDRVAFIDRGEIVALDSPENLKKVHGDTATLDTVFMELTGRVLT